MVSRSRSISDQLRAAIAAADFARNRLRVPSPKTEHIEGRASRVTPLFPELRKPLLEVFDQAPVGSDHVITKYRAATPTCGRNSSESFAGRGSSRGQSSFTISEPLGKPS